jgi:gas vesicle protein
VINKLANLGFLRIAGLAAGAAAVSGAAVLLTASASGYSLPFSTSSPQAARANTASIPGQLAAKPSAVCTDFVSHFAADIKASQADVNAAFQKAIGETLADEVKNGHLTQKQADAIKKRLAGKAPCAIAPQLRPGGGLGAYRPALLSAEASALGITDQALKVDLAKGMTLSQIATAQKVTETQFRSRLIAKLTPVLDAAVTNKQLTTKQEQAIIKRLQTGPLPLWNKPIRPGKAPASAAPSA